MLNFCFKFLVLSLILLNGLIDNCLIAQQNVSSDSKILEFYSFNEDLSEVNIFRDSLAPSAKFLFDETGPEFITMFEESIQNLKENNDFIGNVECFTPALGILLKNDEKLIESYSISVDCNKIYYMNHITGDRGYLYFHNNEYFLEFYETYNLARFETR